MRRILLLSLLFTLFVPAVSFARSNHNGWHGAAPVKKSKMQRQRPSPLPFS